MSMADVSIAILTGGISRRFGSNKLIFEIEGERVVDRVYNKVRDLSPDVFFQGDSVDDVRDSRPDLVEGKGPLGGIYSALKNSRFERTIVLAGDLPCLDARILGELLKDVQAEVVVPRWRKGHNEPLCALYSKKLLPHIVHMIESGDWKISNLYERVPKIKWIDIDRLIESGRLDRNCFLNLNKRQDLSG